MSGASSGWFLAGVGGFFDDGRVAVRHRHSKHVRQGEGVANTRRDSPLRQAPALVGETEGVTLVVGRVARVSIGIPVLAAELGHNSAEGAPGSGFWNLGLGLIFLSRSSIHPHQRFCLAEIKSPTAPRPIF